MNFIDPFSSAVFRDDKYHEDKVKNMCFGNALNGKSYKAICKRL